MHTDLSLPRFKLPRTPHLKWSPGRSSDDLQYGDIAWLEDREVVVSVKLDGEGFSVYSDGYCHARSIDGRHHLTQSWIKAKVQEVAYRLPSGFRLCGEYMIARHTFSYNALESYFYVFAAFDDSNVCLDWDTTEQLASQLEFPIVPVLYRGIWDERKVKECYTGNNYLGGDQEGYVVRLADAFQYDEFGKCVAKFVCRKFKKELDERANLTGHWSTNGSYQPNYLRSR